MKIKFYIYHSLLSSVSTAAVLQITKNGNRSCCGSQVSAGTSWWRKIKGKLGRDCTDIQGVCDKRIMDWNNAIGEKALGNNLLRDFNQGNTWQLCP